MDDFLVIGAGPAGLMAAWQARRRGTMVRLMASGIGSTHLMPGWIGVLNTEGNVAQATSVWSEWYPDHPYALTGLAALSDGIASLQELGDEFGLPYVGGLEGNFRLPTALGMLMQAALAPASFAAGDARRPGAALIAGPAGWRDFYPALCADNLTRAGMAAGAAEFAMPELRTAKHDPTSLTIAELFERSEVRSRVAAEIRAKLNGAQRVGMPAVLGMDHSHAIWQELQERIGVPVFEIPTLSPSVPGIRLFRVLRQALARHGVRVLLDMTASRGTANADGSVTVNVPTVAREALYGAKTVILATGGLYGGGISSDHTGQMREVVFDLPISVPGPMENWFNLRLFAKGGHPVHLAGVRTNRYLQPIDAAGRVSMEGVRIAGRLLAGYDPLVEGSTEGVWLATSSAVIRTVA